LSESPPPASLQAKRRRSVALAASGSAQLFFSVLLRLLPISGLILSRQLPSPRNPELPTSLRRRPHQRSSRQGSATDRPLQEKKSLQPNSRRQSKTKQSSWPIQLAQ
jgi:hypothetical protein